MLPLVLAGLSVLQQKEKNEQAQRDRLLAAQTQKYSPWTHLQAGPISQKGSVVGAGIGGYTSGLGQEQANQLADLNQQKAQAEIGYLNRGNQPAAEAPTAGPTELDMTPGQADVSEVQNSGPVARAPRPMGSQAGISQNSSNLPPWYRMNSGVS